MPINPIYPQLFERVSYRFVSMQINLRANESEETDMRDFILSHAPFASFLLSHLSHSRRLCGVCVYGRQLPLAMMSPLFVERKNYHALERMRSRCWEEENMGKAHHPSAGRA